MKKERKIAGTIADPTLPKTPVTVGGKTYDLCFDLGALAEAEQRINIELLEAKREPINLLAYLPGMNLSSIRHMFAAGVRTFHPEIGFDEAAALVKLADVYEVADKIREAWNASTPEATKEARPTPAGE